MIRSLAADGHQLRAAFKVGAMRYVYNSQKDTPPPPFLPPMNKYFYWTLQSASGRASFMYIFLPKRKHPV